MEEDDVAVEAALLRAELVSAPMSWSDGSAIGTLLRRSLRFVRSEEEMERFLVLISKRSRFLSVIPESMAIRMHTRLAKVKPNGKPTQTNLPKPMIAEGGIND